MSDEMTKEERKVLQRQEDELFMKSVQEARQLDFEFVCVDCGEGIDPGDEEPMHGMLCPRNPELEENKRKAEAWYAREQAKKEASDGA